jgi:RHS repeat-associated protein
MLYPGVQGDENDPGFMQTLINFFKRLWSPQTQSAENLGFSFAYDEDGSLVWEQGTGGANSTGAVGYFWLPTPTGPMPIAAKVNSRLYAVHADHLNTPGRLTQSDGRVAWQWAYSAFGEEQPTLGKNRFANLNQTPNPGTTTIPEVTFNLRYPGQYFDKESGLHYNWHRSYRPGDGRYTQPDPIELDWGVESVWVCGRQSTELY